MTNFVPLITNTDIFGYYWSRSMHDAYGVKSYIIGQTPLAFTNTSTIIEEIKYVEHLKTNEGFVREVIAYAADIKERHNGAEVVLVPTDDNFVQLAINNREALEPYVKFHVPSKELMDQIMNKERFYDLAKKHGIPMAYTQFYQMGSTIPQLDANLFPVVIKPNNGILYYQHPFEGQDKLYFVDNQERLEKIINKIEASGYDDKLIIQEFVPGDDTYLGDSNCYINTNGDCHFISLSQVVLQEPESTAVGNYVAQIAKFDEKIMKRFRQILLDINYTGFANFDFKIDPRTGEYKVFEINMRAGRSAFYVEYADESLAKNLVDDIIFGKCHEDTHYLEGGYVSSFAPKFVIKRFATEGPIKVEAMRLINEGKFYNPLKNPNDKHVKRAAYLAVRDVNYYKKFRDNDWTKVSD